MDLLGFLLRRVESPAPEATRAEDGFVHAPDATPEETLTPRGRQRALFSGHEPAGWKRVLGQGTALGPWSSDAGGSGDGGSGNSDGGGF